MALITLPAGNVLVPWIGPATTLAGQPWFTAANLAAVYRASDNRLSYVSNAPGAAFPGFPQVLPTPAGQVPNAYIFVIKAAFALDSALIGQPVVVPNPVLLVAHFAPGQTALAFPLKITGADQPGTYNLDPNSPISGLTGISYTKAGSAMTLPVVMGLNEILTITGTTAPGVDGFLTLIKQ